MANCAAWHNNLDDIWAILPIGTLPFPVGTPNLEQGKQVWSEMNVPGLGVSRAPVEQLEYALYAAGERIDHSIAGSCGGYLPPQPLPGIPSGPPVPPPPVKPPTDPTDPNESYPCSSGHDEPCYPGQVEHAQCCTELANCGATVSSLVASVKAQALACLGDCQGNIGKCLECLSQVVVPIIQGGDTVCRTLATEIANAAKVAIQQAAEIVGAVGQQAAGPQPAGGFILWVHAGNLGPECYCAPAGQLPMFPGDESFPDPFPTAAACNEAAINAGCKMIPYAPPAGGVIGQQPALPRPVPPGPQTIEVFYPGIGGLPGSIVNVPAATGPIDVWENNGTIVASPRQPITALPRPVIQPPTTVPSPPAVPAGQVEAFDATVVDTSSLPSQVILPPKAERADYCGVMSEVSGILEAFGGQLLSGNAVAAKVVTQTLGHVVRMPANVASDIGMLIEWYTDTPMYHDIISRLNVATAAYADVANDKLRNLLAVKQVIDYLRTISWGTARNSDMHWSKHISVGGEAAKFGFGADFTGNGSLNFSVKAEIKLVVVNLDRVLQQCINRALPQEIPGIDAAIELLLSDTISEDHCRCLVELNGGVWSQWQLAVNARRSKLVADQILALYLRKKLSLQEALAGLRAIGYTSREEVDRLLALTEQIPGPQDIVRFMVRDVVDPNIVDRFKLDSEFPAKYQGGLRGYGEAQGLTEQLAKYFWRAHWNVPSPQQLFEMYHRLRPDNRPAGVRPEDWDTSLDDVDAALGQDDTLPHWRTRFLQVAFSPLTRIDARRAFQTGAITRDQFISAMKDIGYNADNAALLANFVERLRDEQLSRGAEVKLLVRGAIKENTLRDKLALRKLTPEAIERIVNDAKDTIAQQTLEKCTKAAKKRYFSGEFDKQGIVNFLVQLGLDLPQANNVVAQWTCELQSRSKELNAATLCRYAERGLLDAVTYYSRLRTLGFDDTDARLIVVDCQARISERQAKALEAASKVQQAALAKQAALAEKIRKQQEALQQKQLTQAAKLAKEQRALDRRLNKSAHKYAKLKDEDIDTVDTEYRDAIQALADRHKLAFGIAAEMVIRAGDNWTKQTRGSLLDQAEREYAGLQRVGPVEGTGHAVT